MSFITRNLFYFSRLYIYISKYIFFIIFIFYTKFTRKRSLFQEHLFTYIQKGLFKKETNKKEMKNEKQMIGQPVTFFGKVDSCPENFVRHSFNYLSQFLFGNKVKLPINPQFSGAKICRRHFKIPDMISLIQRSILAFPLLTLLNLY